MLVLSQSGETEEVVRLLPSLAEFGVPIVAVTAPHGAARWAARPRAVDRAGPAARSLLAGPGPQHQHDRHAGRGRRPGAGDQPDARFSPRGFCPLSSGRQPGAAAEQGRRLHAAAGRLPRGRRSAKRARGVRRAQPRGPPHRRDHADRRRRDGWPACLPTATWRGCSKVAATRRSIGRFAR